MGLNKGEYSTSKTIKLGEWNNNYNECLTKANSDNIPMVLYWTPGSGCGWCSSLEENCFRSSNFKTWQKSKPYIFCYTEGESHPIYSGGANSTIRDNFLYGYPYIWLHWNISGLMTIDERFSGRPSDFPIAGKGSETARYKSFMTSVDQFFQYYIKK